jgi:hypothetical protein
MKSLYKQGVKLVYPWQEEHPFIGASPEEKLMLNCAQANEYYREGIEFPVADNEYDFMLDQLSDEGFKNLVGTKMNVLDTLKAMHALRIEKGWEQRYPPPVIPAHHVTKYQLWDVEMLQMDCDVCIHGNYVLIPGDEADVEAYKANLLEWGPEQLVVINNHPHYRTPLDNFMVLRQFTNCRTKEGTEIYAGDLLKTPDGELVRVYYDHTLSSWSVTDKEVGDVPYIYSRPLFLFGAVSSHAGNIYQNPTTFKGKKV